MSNSTLLLRQIGSSHAAANVFMHTSWVYSMYSSRCHHIRMAFVYTSGTEQDCAITDSAIFLDLVPLLRPTRHLSLPCLFYSIKKFSA